MSAPFQQSSQKAEISHFPSALNGDPCESRARNKKKVPQRATLKAWFAQSLSLRGSSSKEENAATSKEAQITSSWCWREVTPCTKPQLSKVPCQSAGN